MFHDCKKEDHIFLCENVTVPCTYSTDGCTHTMLRKDLLTHLASHQGVFIIDATGQKLTVKGKRKRLIRSMICD